MFGQVVDDFDARQISQQWLALATAWSRGNDFLVSIADWEHRLAFRFVEQCQLRCVVLDRLLGLATKDAVTQQLDLFFEINDVSGVSFFDFLRIKQRLLKQYGVVWKVVG